MNNTVNNENKSNVFQGRFRKSFVERMFDQFKEWNNRRQAIQQLNMMSDSFLRDIGIERYQISDVVNQKGAFAELNISHNKAAKTASEIKRAA
ncbi:MAG: DUF1127 domain-containing protein [Gammaproteobacteria bacterium]|nr:DUF1127 domain-containing protein [Gammaproteobacteria bacterium]